MALQVLKRGPHGPNGPRGGYGPRVKVTHWAPGAVHEKTPFPCGQKNNETKFYTSQREEVTCPGCKVAQ